MKTISAQHDPAVQGSRAPRLSQEVRLSPSRLRRGHSVPLIRSHQPAGNRQARAPPTACSTVEENRWISF
jgi:hypothetical protein